MSVSMHVNTYYVVKQNLISNSVIGRKKRKEMNMKNITRLSIEKLSEKKSELLREGAEENVAFMLFDSLFKVQLVVP